MNDPMIDIVRKALGRTEALANPPKPPEIPDAIARLVPKDANFVERFVESAIAAKMQVMRVTAEEIGGRLTEFLRQHGAKMVGIPASNVLDRLDIPSSIEAAGASVIRWDESTLDAAYDLDIGVTDVYAAVAETGSLVIRPDPGHGRALSLVPMVHVAIVEPTNIVADLIDLMAKLAAEPRAANITIITGPSKTADIEGELVTGVHGPGVVGVFLVE
jgi:L-lactate dehydrogenase complex protein LldG